MKNFQTNNEILKPLPVRSTNINRYEKKTQASYKMYLSLIYYLKQTYIPKGVLPYEYLYHCPALCQIICVCVCVCVCVNGESEGVIWKVQSGGERLKNRMGVCMHVR